MLFCITANYTPKALEAMGKNPKTNRREAVEKLVTAAGGKLVAMYGTIEKAVSQQKSLKEQLVPLHSDYDSLVWPSRREAGCG